MAKWVVISKIRKCPIRRYSICPIFKMPQLQEINKLIEKKGEHTKID